MPEMLDPPEKFMDLVAVISTRPGRLVRAMDPVVPLLVETEVGTNCALT